MINLLLYVALGIGNNSILGNWFIKNKRATISIKENNGAYLGSVSWIKPTPSSAKFNRDSAPISFNATLPDQDVLFLSDGQEDNSYEGKYCDYETGIWYECKVISENSNLRIKLTEQTSNSVKAENWGRAE